MKIRDLFLACAVVAPLKAQADIGEDDFVSANLISVFYHEMGHALIDILRLPVFGQEEDAADTASILFINYTFNPEEALSIAYDAALGFAAAAEDEGNIDQTAWDVHGASLQRFYNLVCIFYGADADGRDSFAEDMGLPEERALTCQEEFELADDSWGPVFDELFDAGAGDSLTYQGASDTFTHDIIAAEVDAINALMSQPETLEITVEPCGEANAFYDPAEVKITICSEFEPYLRKIAP